MNYVRLINYFDVIDSAEVYHFGWPAEMLAALKIQLQSKYYGDVDDAILEISNDLGEIYYAVFKTNSEWGYRTKDYLLLHDNNRVLLNIGGTLYRFLIAEKRILDSSCYDDINTDSYYFHSLNAPKHQLVIIADDKGISAIDWDKIVWQHQFEFAEYGGLRLIGIKGNTVIVEYDDMAPGNLSNISFDLESGESRVD